MVVEEFPGPNVWTSRRQLSMCIYGALRTGSRIYIRCDTGGCTKVGALAYITNADALIGTEVIEGYNGPEGGFHRGYRYLESNLFCIYEHIVLNNILKFQKIFCFADQAKGCRIKYVGFR